MTRWFVFAVVGLVLLPLVVLSGMALGVLLLVCQVAAFLDVVFQKRR